MPEDNKKIVCRYVVDGVEVFSESVDDHPGMQSFVKEWVESKLLKIPFHKIKDMKPGDKITEEVRNLDRFYFSHLAPDGSHIFYRDRGFTGETIK